jgi:hypothetical protein
MGICTRCVEIHAIPDAEQNFELDRGFSIYDLPLYGERVTSVHWDTITPETNFEQAYNYIKSVAEDYMRNGDTVCKCQD